MALSFLSNGTTKPPVVSPPTNNVAATQAKLAALGTTGAQRAAAAGTPMVSKPSPTSVTGQPKTNANNNISGSIQSSAAQTTGSSSNGTPNYPQTTIPLSQTNVGANGDTYTDSGFNISPVKTDNVAATQDKLAALGTTGAQRMSAAKSSGATNNTGMTGTNVPVTGDDQAAALKAATDEQVAGLNSIKADLESGKSSDMELIQQQYLAQQAELDRSLNVLQTLHEQNLSAIDSATAASQVANENAVKKQEAATKLAQQQVDQKYLELKAAQQLANKRAQIQKETSLGVLGGSFTTAGVADIQETIAQGDQAITSLGLSNISQNTAFTNDLNSFYDDYRQKNLEIQATKISQVNQSYASLQQSIASIQASKEMSSEEKTRAILSAGQNYNTQVASINSEIVQAKYNLATNVIARADSLKAQASTAAKEQAAATNLERDDARTAIQNMIASYPATAFSSMTPEQKTQMQALELKAGYPQGMVEQGITSMKESLNDAKINQMDIASDQKQQLIDLKAKLGTKINAFTNGDGTVTVVYSDPITGQSTAIPMGQIGKPDSPWQLSVDGAGNTVLLNKTTGKTTSGEVNPNVNNSIVGQEGTKGTVQDALAIPDGTNGGECGAFVNDYLGKRVMGDSYQSKQNQTNSTTPEAGSVFVMPVTLKDGSQSPNGHTGFVKSVGTNPATGNPGVQVKDSNWSSSDDHLVRTHWFDQSQITGYISPSGGSTTSQPSSTPEHTTLWGKIAAAIGIKTTAPEDLSTKDLADQLTVWNDQAGTPKATSFYNKMSRTQLVSAYKDAATAAANAKTVSKAKATAAETAANEDNAFNDIMAKYLPNK